MTVAEPRVYKVVNGWHAASDKQNMAVWGATESEARANFSASLKRRDELLAEDRVRDAETSRSQQKRSVSLSPPS